MLCTNLTLNYDGNIKYKLLWQTFEIQTAIIPLVFIILAGPTTIHS